MSKIFDALRKSGGEEPEPRPNAGTGSGEPAAEPTEYPRPAPARPEIPEVRSADEAFEAVEASVTDAPDPLPLGLPADVRAVVRACLSKDPEDRPPTLQQTQHGGSSPSGGRGCATVPAIGELPLDGLAAAGADRVSHVWQYQRHSALSVA